MELLGTVHLALAIASLILGAAVLFRQKGGSRHRVFGYLYSGALLLVNLIALSVYENSSGLGPFHILALISLATLTGGFVPAFMRCPNGSWLELHAYFMSWSYVGLIAAGVAQMVTMFAGPGPHHVVIPTVLIVLVGALLIHGRVPQILSGLTRGEVRPNHSLHRTPSALTRDCRR